MARTEAEGVIVCPATHRRFRYFVKHLKRNSSRGIDGARITKLNIRRIGEDEDIVDFDGIWNLEPTDETRVVFEILRKTYN